MGDFDGIFNHISKQVKKDSNAAVYKAGDIRIKSRIPFGILTGIPELDLSLGRPGWPAGRVIELFGFERCGKTTCAFHALSNAQKAGGGGIYLDLEKTWDEDRARSIGVNPEVNFAVGDADSVDSAFRFIEHTVEGIKKSGFEKPFVIIVDSVTGAATEYQKTREIGEEMRVGQDARTIRAGMRKITSDVAESNVLLFMVNHAIAKIAMFGKKSQAAGGHAIKLLSSVRCEFTALGDIKEDGDKDHLLGQSIQIKIEKSKLTALEWPNIKTDLMNTIGFDTEASLLRAMIKVGLVDHAHGSKSYTFVPTKEEFPVIDWPEVVLKGGGLDKMYKTFIDWSLEHGKMRAW